MDDSEREEIRLKHRAVVASYSKLDEKAQHIQEVVRGLETLLSDVPKNIDCTDMTDTQITEAKTNLFRFADAVIDE